MSPESTLQNYAEMVTAKPCARRVEIADAFRAVSQLLREAGCRVVLYATCLVVACSNKAAPTPPANRDTQTSPAPVQSAPIRATEVATGSETIQSPLSSPSTPSAELLEPACMQSALTQFDRGMCAGQDRDEARRELDKVLNQVLHRWPDPKIVRKVRAAQAAWLKYRDAELNACFPAADQRLVYGSSFPERWALEEARLMRMRVRALQGYLSEQGESCPK